MQRLVGLSCHDYLVAGSQARCMIDHVSAEREASTFV
jgi:hypothetical protein